MRVRTRGADPEEVQRVRATGLITRALASHQRLLSQSPAFRHISPERNASKPSQRLRGHRRIVQLAADLEAAAEECGRAVVLAHPECHEAGVDERLNPQARVATERAEDAIEPEGALFEPLLRDPEPIQRIREAERFVGALLVDEPLNGGKKVVVSVLEELERALGSEAPQARAGLFGSVQEGLGGTRIHWRDLILGNVTLNRLPGPLRRWLYAGGTRQDRLRDPDAVVAALDLQPGVVVGDLGPGAGHFTLRIARAVEPGGVVYALDARQSTLDELRRAAHDRGIANLRSVLVRRDRLEIPEPVDLLFVSATYHHLAEPPKYFADARAHLRPGARVAILESRREGLLASWRGRHASSPRRVLREMAEAGYRLTTTHDVARGYWFGLFEAAHRPAQP